MNFLFVLHNTFKKSCNHRNTAKLNTKSILCPCVFPCAKIDKLRNVTLYVVVQDVKLDFGYGPQNQFSVDRPGLL
jgi:hypothetical protein